jgi:hypothetical protein
MPLNILYDEKTLVTVPVVTRVILVGGLIAKRYYTSPPTKWDGQLNVTCMIKIGDGSL